MLHTKIVRTTLGDLIAAVTAEVAAEIGDSSRTYLVVSHIMSDLLQRHRVRTRVPARPSRNGKGRG